MNFFISLGETVSIMKTLVIKIEKVPKPCKSIGEPHTKPLHKRFKDHRNSRKYWRR